MRIVLRGRRPRRWLAGMVLASVALLGAPASHAVQQSRPTPNAAEKDLSFDELPDDVRTVVAAQHAVQKYRQEHPAVVFRLSQATPTSPIKRVGIRLHGNEVGYLMLQNGRLRNGQLGAQRLTPSHGGTPESNDAESEPPAESPPLRGSLDLAALQQQADALAASAGGRPRTVVLRRSGRILSASIDDGLPFNLGRILRVNNAEMAPPDWQDKLKARLTTRAAMPPVKLVSSAPARVEEGASEPDDEPAQIPEMTPPSAAPSSSQETPATAPSLQAPAASAPAPQSHRAAAPSAKPADRPAATTPPHAPVVSRAPVVETSSAEPTDAPTRSWLPMTGGVALAWVAVVLVLALTLRTDALLSLRTLDGLVLAATCPLLLARDAEHGPLDGLAGFPGRWWAYAALTLIALYWAARGLVLLKARRIAEFGANVSPGAMLVMLAFGLTIAGARIIAAPLHRSSLDGIIGGRYLHDHGRLPYGQTPGADGQSPLLYALHGAVARVMPTYVELGGNRVPPQWSTRNAWQTPGWENTLDRRAAVAVNSLLAVLVVVALYLIGRRLNSTPVGLTLATAFCVFPGAVESLSNPAVMLPAALLAWTVALATLPGVGGLLSTLCAVLAGTAWPWAWLILPALLVYFLRSGLGGAGAVLGSAGGAAGVLAGLVAYAQPALPRAEGALAAAGVTPLFAADFVDGQVLITRATPAGAPDSNWITRVKSALWLRLVDDVTTLTVAPAGVSLPTGVSPRDVTLCRLACDEESRLRLGAILREATASAGPMQKTQAALRTVLEAVWMPVDEPPAEVVPAWNVWAAGREGGARAAVLPAAWANYRRLAKLAAVLVAAGVAVLLALDRRRSTVQVVGASLTMIATALVASPVGAVASYALLAAAALPVFAAHCDDAQPVRGRAALPPRPPGASKPAGEPAERPVPRGSMPRITVEN